METLLLTIGALFFIMFAAYLVFSFFRQMKSRGVL